jgi:carbon-monoxide dehydrogenase large subunit
MTTEPVPGLGTPYPRLEDPDLLTGRARFTADLDAPGALHAALVRSPLAHARIQSVDPRPALAVPGVRYALTADDLDVPAVSFPPFAGQLHDAHARPPLARGVVRFVGDPVAAVLATSRRAAAEGAREVRAGFQPLPAVTSPQEALADEVLLFPETGSNVALHSVAEHGVPGPSEVTTGTRVENQRMAVAPMEPNAILALPAPDGTMTVWLSTQMPHGFRDLLTSLLGLGQDAVRVIAPAVGGGFGGKNPFDADYVLICAMARHVGSPVRWVQTRAENLLTMQGRGHAFDVRLSSGRDGTLGSLDVNAVSDVGAYPGVGVGMIHTARSLASGPYRIPHVRYEIRCVTSNTAPTVAFRGAGRPEGAHALERAMDEHAAALGMDPAELRLRNFIPANAFPYTSPMGATYDTGSYARALRLALGLAGYDEIRAEQRARRQAGDPLLLGVGIGSYVEVSAAPPGFGREYASVEVEADGGVLVTAGTSAHGQGHWTMYALVAATVLGVDPARVRLVQSDTALVPSGVGTGGSRSAQVGGSAVKVACEEVLDKARRLAAHLRGVSPEKITVVAATGLAVDGVPGSELSWADLAAAAQDEARRPEGMTGGLAAAPGFDQGYGTAPFGSHVAAAEVDSATGLVRLRKIVAVDDCGTVLNPLTADGQVHGGLAASIGQALFEESVFGADGVLRQDSFGTYQMPAAADLPSFETAHTVTPATKNPLGAKGLGEGGSIGVLAAVHNAVMDAVRHLGVTGLQTPLTPLRVWSAIQDAAAEG